MGDSAALAPLKAGPIADTQGESQLVYLRSHGGILLDVSSNGQGGVFRPDSSDVSSRAFRRPLGHFRPMAQAIRDKNATAMEAAVRARLRQLRDARGWTAETAAEALGVEPPDTYRKWETRNNPPLWLLPRIALVYNVSLEWLLTGKEGRMPSAIPKAI